MSNTSKHGEGSEKDYPQTVLEQEQAIIQEMSPFQKGSFPIVGLGSSAGGLQALIKFFTNMPSDCGMAFIVIQHMSPDTKSTLHEILQRHTRMHVACTEEGMRIKPNHIYVIPPDKNMYIAKSTLRLFGKPDRPYVAHSIDVFFRSMAESLEDQAIAIILSGTGSDGTFGARLVNQKLGLVIAQDPTTTQFNSMPLSAIQAGVADFVLYPEKIPEHLIEYVNLFLGKPAQERWRLLTNQEYDLRELFALVHNRTGIDLSIYKLPTIYRRIGRRMSMLRIENYNDYVEFIRLSQSEAHTLLAFALISITRFFQEPKACIALKEYLKEELAREKTSQTFYAWTLGCGTGEETYTVAMLIQECIEELRLSSDFKVLATDIDKNAINLAQTGLFPSSIAKEDVSQDRLNRFFNKKDSYYEIKQEIRGKVTFSIRNYTDSPPLENAGFISPRSMFLFLNPKSQHGLMPIFYSAMKPNGILFLGISDAMYRYKRIFNLLDSKWEIYNRI
jgi:two-component system, chemotaxis family, CheB/CheR fusion protein